MPIAASTGSARANAAGAAPTMIVSVPFARARRTAADRRIDEIDRRAAASRSAKRRDATGEIVDISMTSAARLRARPPRRASPKSTSSTCGASGTQTNHDIGSPRRPLPDRPLRRRRSARSRSSGFASPMSAQASPRNRPGSKRADHRFAHRAESDETERASHQRRPLGRRLQDNRSLAAKRAAMTHCTHSADSRARPSTR